MVFRQLIPSTSMNVPSFSIGLSIALCSLTGSVLYEYNSPLQSLYYGTCRLFEPTIERKRPTLRETFLK